MNYEQTGVKRILRDILFINGPLEIILNFLLFVPFFFALLVLAPGLSRSLVALISCLTSAVAELAQFQVPGRVSSLRDFFSNCLGVLVALVIVTSLSKRRTSREN
jgi:glycopeptide antibiotics resistance protein